MAVSDTARMGELTHKILLWTDALQAIPWWAMTMIFAALAMLIALCWPHAPLVGLGYFAAIQANAVALMLLPVMDVSHGPDRASSLGLAAVFGIPLAIAGLLGWSPAFAIIFLIVMTCIAQYSAWLEPFRLDVVRQRKSVPGWDPARPLRVAHISDLHAEHFGPRERRLNRLLSELKPDLIVFSGDFINLSYVKDPKVRAVVRQIVAEWHAPLGVYAVSGTSPEVDLPDDLAYYLQDSQAQAVNGRWVTVEAGGGTVNVGGIASWHVMRTDRAALEDLLRSRPEGGAHILLVHTPDLAPEAAKAGIDLYLCGHTHGGQLCLPGGIPIVTGSHLGRRFMRGRVEVDATTVYTTRGIGFEGLGAPRARLFCRPEITLWEITA